MDGEPRGHDKLESILEDRNSAPCILSSECLRKITNNFSDEGLLGEGGFGKVYKGVLQNGKLVAVKKLELLKPGVQDKQFENEVALLMRLKHQNIVRFVGYCYEAQKEYIELNGSYVFAEMQRMFICLEYLSNGSLDRYISDQSSGLDWGTRYEIIKGVCYGLHYLHEECKCQINASIIHLDLKPANILLDDNMVPKVADFGLSRMFDEKQFQTRITSSLTGTLGYMPPEYIYKHEVTVKADIYSLGVILIEVITGSRIDPYYFMEETSCNGFVEEVLQSWRKRPKISETHCKQIKCCIEIGLSCIKVKRNERPKTGEIIEKLNECESTSCSVNNEERPQENEMSSAAPLPSSWSSGLEKLSYQGETKTHNHRLQPNGVPERLHKSASVKSAFSHFKAQVVEEAVLAVEARRPATTRDGATAWRGGRWRLPMVALKDLEAEARGEVVVQAENINRFHNQLKLQRMESILHYREDHPPRPAAAAGGGGGGGGDQGRVARARNPSEPRGLEAVYTGGSTTLYDLLSQDQS